VTDAQGDEPDLVVDCLGRPCPVPVIELARAVRTVELGQVVEVLTDDPAARHDVPAWCRMTGQESLGPSAQGQRVRRRA
jgi:TusA-related sulfurtransferase